MGAFDSDLLVEVIQILTEIVQNGLDLNNVMSMITEKAKDLTQADGAVIELAENGEMVYRATSGTANKQLGLRINIEGSLSGLCYLEEKPQLCVDSANDDRVDKAACDKVGLKSMAIVPLVHMNSPVGVLKVLSSKVSQFDDRTLNLLELMSGVIASSMHNATKYESDELFYRATYDELTEVANRSLFYDRLRQRCYQAKRAQEDFGVISIDVDGLKEINDTLGHRAGDVALREIAFRLKKAVRESDTVARLGGDEFGIILYKVKNPEEAEQLVDRLNQMVEKPFYFDHHDIKLSVSVGFALFSENSGDMEELIDTADREMYQVKKKRKQGA